MDKILADLLREKKSGDRLDHEEWNAMVRAHKRDLSGSEGSVDELADMRTTKHPGRPWFHCSCTETIPKYSVFALGTGTVVSGRPKLSAAKIDADTAGHAPLLTNGVYEGTVAGGCFVRFIDEWEPVLLKINGSPIASGDQTGPKVDTFEVDESGAGLVAVTGEDPVEADHQWFVRSQILSLYPQYYSDQIEQPFGGGWQDAMNRSLLIQVAGRYAITVTGTATWGGASPVDVGDSFFEFGVGLVGGGGPFDDNARTTPMLAPTITPTPIAGKVLKSSVQFALRIHQDLAKDDEVMVLRQITSGGVPGDNLYSSVRITIERVGPAGGGYYYDP